MNRFLFTGQIPHLRSRSDIAGIMRLGLSIAFVALVFVRPCQAGLDHFESSGSMTFAREGHAATLLTDGKVLVEGGDGSGLTSAELFDPTTGTWTLTGGTNSGRQ
jgi:hypothetical protein